MLPKEAVLLLKTYHEVADPIELLKICATPSSQTRGWELLIGMEMALTTELIARSWSRKLGKLDIVY